MSLIAAAYRALHCGAMRFEYTGGALAKVNADLIEHTKLIRVLMVPEAGITNFQVRGRVVTEAGDAVTILDAATLNWADPTAVSAAGVRYASYDGPTPIGDITPVAFVFDSSLLGGAEVWYHSAGDAVVYIEPVDR